jgi:CheY-like chemotaxis protein
MAATAHSEVSVQVLVVEDNPGDARIVRYALAEADSWPVKLTVAEDGEKAIQYLLRKGAYASAPRPDLVILDLNLPKYPGTEVLKVIRENSALRHTQVFILSSSPEDVIRNTVHSARVEADGYFTKPPDLDEFIGLGKKIRHCFELARAG